MIVVSDTSPLTALLTVGEAGILTIPVIGGGRRASPEILAPRNVRDSSVRSGMFIGTQSHKAPPALRQERHAGPGALRV